MMVEAVEGGDSFEESLIDLNFFDELNESYLSKKHSAENSNNTVTSPTLLNTIQESLYNDHVGELLFNKLCDKGLHQYEKYLGAGVFGKVLQLEGSGPFEGKKLALKLLPFNDTSSYFSYWNNNNISEKGAQGDAIALQLPQKCHLNRAYALFTFDGKEVHYVEKIDPELHQGHIVIGILMRAIEGGTLSSRIAQYPFNAEAVRGYGKQLAEALHSLHQAGYAHGDLHTGNVLVKEEQEDKFPYRIKLSDFGLSLEISDFPEEVQADWRHYGILLVQMALQAQLNTTQSLISEPPLSSFSSSDEENYYLSWSELPQFLTQGDLKCESDLLDLLLNSEKGLLTANEQYSEVEILNHPFFAKV